MAGNSRGQPFGLAVFDFAILMELQPRLVVCGQPEGLLDAGYGIGFQFHLCLKSFHPRRGASMGPEAVREAPENGGRKSFPSLWGDLWTLLGHVFVSLAIFENFGKGKFGKH